MNRVTIQPSPRSRDTCHHASSRRFQYNFARRLRTSPKRPSCMAELHMDSISGNTRKKNLETKWQASCFPCEPACISTQHLPSASSTVARNQRACKVKLHTAPDTAHWVVLAVRRQPPHKCIRDCYSRRAIDWTY